MELTGNQKSLNRTFKKLRVSITESCNLACMYCDSQNGSQASNIKNGEKSDLSMLLDIVLKLHARLDFLSVRITGGEPTLNPQLPFFIRQLKLSGIPEVNITTNGIFLENILPDLYEAGLDRINISLDAVDEDTFSRITGHYGRRNVSRVIRSILRAKEFGFHVKINSIIMRGINENQVLPILEYATGIHCVPRFLELMKMGWAINSHKELFYPESEILSQIQLRHKVTPLPRNTSSTANYYQMENGSVFGIIANHSQPFCTDCDRLRLDHRGNLYGCLSNSVFFPLAAKKSEDYGSILESAIMLKQRSEFSGSVLNMRHIGG